MSKEQGLPYWKARAGFDFSDKYILIHQHWRLMFPEVYELLDACRDAPAPELGKVWIPYAMLIEMAKETQIVFAVNKEGDHLGATTRQEFSRPGYVKITALEALERYGPQCVFEATDGGSSQIK